MLLENKKNYKGVKLLKVDQQLFKNAKRYSSKGLSNENSLNPSQNNQDIRKSVRSSLHNYPLNIEEEKSLVPNIIPINKNYKKISSSSKYNELKFLKKALKKKEEEKKESDITINKNINNKVNKKKIRYMKTFSCKNLNLKNHLLENKNKIINNINIINDNKNMSNMVNDCNFNNNKKNIKVKKDKDKDKDKVKVKDKEKEKEKNIINNNENKNAVSCEKKENIINVRNETTNTNNEENKRSKSYSNNFKKIFCCL